MAKDNRKLMPPIPPEGLHGEQVTTVLSKKPLKAQPAHFDAPPQMGDAMAALEEKRKKRRKSRTVKIIIAIAVVLIGALIVAGTLVAKTISNQVAQNSPTGDVTRGEYVKEVRSSGSLSPIKSQTVSPEIGSGTVLEVKVTPGQRVNQGDVLFTLEAPELQAAVNQAEFNVKSAQQQLNGAKQQYSSAVDSYNSAANQVSNNRNAALKAHNKAVDEYNAALAEGLDVSQIQIPPFDESQYVFDSASAQGGIDAASQGIEAAKIQLESAESAYNEAVKNLEKLTVVAPISGQIMTCNVENGTNISALLQSGKPPIQIADMSQMTVDMQVNEIDILKLKEGLEAKVTFDAIPNLTSKGTAMSISSAPVGADVSGAAAVAGSLGTSGASNIVKYTVRVLIDQPDPQLKIGMSAEAVLTLERFENTLMVPLTSVFDDGSGNSYVVRVTYDNQGVEQTEEVPVKVLSSNESVSAIEGALSPDDKVKLTEEQSSSMLGMS